MCGGYVKNRDSFGFSVIKRFLWVFFALLSSLWVSGQEDYGWWNELHNWQPGMPSWKRMMIISPGYLGPNALPVPEMKKGFNPEQSEFSFSLSRHFHPGDPTQDLSGRLALPFADSKIMFEMYGVIVENYAFTEEIRNERIARDKDGRGIAQGDFYFSTSVQIVKDKAFPNTLFRIAAKTASGGLYAARYSDSPGYFFDFSFSKDWDVSRYGVIRPYGSFGFYSWQTNDEFTLQNDAFMYGVGLEYDSRYWLISGNFSGYSGYMENRDKPQVVTLLTRHDWERSAMSVEVIQGLRHWEYTTIRFTFSRKFDGL